MIDIEYTLFNAIKTALPSSVDCSGTYDKNNKVFPKVIFSVEDNSVYSRFIDSAQIENAADMTFEVKVYSNKKAGKKAECKSLMLNVDEVLSGLNLTRVFCREIPNLQDSTVCCVTARYRAIVDTNLNIYRR